MTAHEIGLNIVVVTPDGVTWEEVQDELIDAVLETHCDYFSIELIVGKSSGNPVDERDTPASIRNAISTATESNRRHH